MDNMVLTDEEIEELALLHAHPIHPNFKDDDDFIELGRAIERAVVAELALREIANGDQEMGLYDAKQPSTLYVYRYEDGRTAVRAPGINDAAIVRCMLSEAMRSMDDGQPVISH